MPDRYVERVLNGDKEAFRFIIRECKDDAYNLAISILKEEYAAKEAVQRAFIKAYEGLDKFRVKQHSVHGFTASWSTSHIK